MVRKSLITTVLLGWTISVLLTPISSGQSSAAAFSPAGQAPAGSKTPPAPPQNDGGDEKGIVIETVTNVTLPVTVTNQDGNFIGGLKREHFQVLENQRPQPIVSFAKQDGLPLNLSLALDTSTSIRNRLSFEKECAKEFLEKLLDNKRDRAALATFNENVNLRQSFTNEFQRIKQQVEGINAADGQTALYDAAKKICLEQMKNATSKRRAILFVTDGADTASRTTLDQAIAVAQQTQVAIYAISTKGGAVFRTEGNPYRNIDDKDLKKLCKDTGGDVFFPTTISQLKRAFELAEQTLRNQYYLVYEPQEATSNGQFRKIEVRVVGKKGLTVLTRAGYFAAPQ
ncbi:MAG: VWA domain-containing protein [Blastocatellia bacterium]|nr:VWA domain-containing protein [Blastocatellia bacterium]